MFLPILCFQFPLTWALNSASGDFALLFLGFFAGHMQSHVCVCMHACISLDSIAIIQITLQSHGFASGELMAKNETCFCFQVFSHFDLREPDILIAGRMCLL